MNQLALFKMLAPKITQAFINSPPQLKILRFNIPALAQSRQFPGISMNPNLFCPDFESTIAPQQQLSQLQQAQESRVSEDQLSTSTNISLACKLLKNNIEGRIKFIQYQANSLCEDSCIYSQLKSINAYTISIFDGHGGPQLAQYSKSKINSFIDCYLQDNLHANQQQGHHKSIQTLIKESLKWSYNKIQDTFFEMYQKQLKMGNKRIKNVGTCGITAIVHNDKVYIGNAGDSQAMFVLQQGMDMFRYSKANQRLSVNNLKERERIRKQWEDIQENIITEQGDNVFYLKGRLQPTRSIGDYYLKKAQHYSQEGEFKGPYLSSQPDINEHLLTKAHKYMIIASDGLWDVLSKQQILNNMMHQQQIDLNKTCYGEQEDDFPSVTNLLSSVLEKSAEACGKSLKDLKQLEPGVRRNYHDDITIAVVSLQRQL